MVSRVSDSVVLRGSTSTSPDCKAVKRCTALTAMILDLAGSPNMVMASARHRSTSRPTQPPLLSLTEKPATPVETPHWTKPLLLTLSKVTPAVAAQDERNKAVPAATCLSAFMVSPRDGRIGILSAGKPRCAEW
ncbi:hypothetical protein D3C87_1387510 [compost metagenome]